MPSTRPSERPITPRLALAMKKTRMIAPLVAPMVRRMAMSRLLFFTSMMRPVTMLSAAMADDDHQDEAHHVALDHQRVGRDPGSWRANRRS